jgi:hypothetical protein
VPGPARAIHLHFLVDPSPGRSRGQPPGIAHVDGRAEEGRLLKGRQTLPTSAPPRGRATAPDPRARHHRLMEQGGLVRIGLLPPNSTGLLVGSLTGRLRPDSKVKRTRREPNQSGAFDPKRTPVTHLIGDGMPRFAGLSVAWIEMS